MSHTLFTKGLVLHTAARRATSQKFHAGYHSASKPKMPSGTAPIRALLRHTTLRATAIAAQRTSYPATHHFSHQAYTHSQTRSRTPSPPPPYAARNISLLASTNAWTHFPTSTSNTLSSVRTFSRTPGLGWASETTPTLPPAAQQAVDEAIEHITDLYGTAKDEFDIASEESEKNSTYAADDRAAAREELDKLVKFYEGVMAKGDGGVGEEVRKRVGGRIRELVRAVEDLEEAALHGD